MRLANKVILITGSATGIGKAIAIAREAGFTQLATYERRKPILIDIY